MTLCPNCGTWIAEEDLERGCFTCGFTVQDVRREKQEARGEDQSNKLNTSSRLPLTSNEVDNAQ